MYNCSDFYLNKMHIVAGALMHARHAAVGRHSRNRRMADVEIAYHGAIVVIAWNGEGRRNCDAEPYC